MRSKLESELAHIKSSTSNDAAETSTLKSRISSLEASNRDTLAVLESKSSSYDKLAEDLSAQHQKSVELRKQVSTLEQNLQAANSAAASTRFREQSLSQEIDLLKKNNEWLDTELKTKTAENQKFRKEKNARIAELQRQTELTISENDNLKRVEANLKSRLNDQTQRIEEHLATIQSLREEAIQAAENYRIELDSTQRLADLQAATAESQKARAQELAATLDELRDEASDEIGRLRAESETEEKEKVAAQERVKELEATIERLEAELATTTTVNSPGRGINGQGMSTPIRAGTPTGITSPLSVSRFKGGLSTTQLYSDCKRLEKQLAAERRRNEDLETAMEDMVKDLETTKPDIDQLRGDNAKLEAGMVEMSSLMDSAAKERDEAVKEARKTRGEVDSLSREGDILRQQLRDLSSEIKVLLMEQHLRENGQNMTPNEISELRSAALVQSSDLDTMNDTGRFISEHLVTFKHLSELQENNTKLLRMIRELGDRMESEEAREKEQVRQAERDELEQLRKKVITYKDELQAMVVQSKSYVKERDMFRSMLTRRGQLPSTSQPSDFARSMPLPPGDGTPPPQQRFGQSLQAPQVGEADYAKLLKDMQAHYDSYRQETATTVTTLRTEINDLSKKNSNLQTDNSRTSSQLSAATQRAEMLQANMDMLRAENNELQKRTYSVMENATKQELKVQQVAEELVEAHGMLESMRRETANLKAEKDLWKNVEKRLIEDNESLRNERGRLDKLNGSLQNMLNEREQSDSESRRRLENTVESLESELQTTKRKLNEELEESRKATLRREYEHEQNQKRIDDLVTTLGTTREELSAAKTSRDHLQARIDDMTVELRSAEERLAVLQSVPSAPQAVGAAEASQNLVSREQELAVEVSELKRDLELKSTEVDRANEQIEDYKNISQAAEERLQELTETNDQYREETEKNLEEREKKIQDLEQRVTDISAELSTTNDELSKLRDEQSESGRRLEEQKAAFDTELARLRDENGRLATTAQFRQEDLKAQAEIATRAQQNYESELLKHAEAAKALQTVRGEANKVKLELVEIRSEAESAKTSLAQKEESWAEQKDRYERELTDLRKRREEVVQQNNILHQQLEGVTNQITALQRDRAAFTEGAAEGPSTSSGLEDLQEVIKYLRREKEIVDVQYHLSTQEAKRLRQQLDHTQSQLDETRLKLDQQRRAEADTERNALSHNKLMETLNELNLFRESSVTLRAQYREAETNLAEKTKHVEELSAQIEPLQIRIGELENLAETREGEMKLLQEDRDRWQQRTQNILQKYDRVDPAEVEAQKQKLESLEKERDEVVSEKAQLQQQIDNFPGELETAKSDLRNRLAEQFKTRSKQLTTRIQEKQVEVDAVNAEKVNLEQQIEGFRKELEAAKAHSVASQPGTTQASETAKDSSTVSSDQSSQVRQLEEQLSHLRGSLSEKEKQLQTLKTEYEGRFSTRESELKEALSQQASRLRAELESTSNKALKELEERLKANHAQELEALRSQSSQSQPQDSAQQAQSTENATNGDTPSKPTNSTDELPVLTDAQVRQLVQKNEVIRNIIKVNIQKAVAREKENIKKELQAAETAATSSISPSTLEELEKRHLAEKDALTKELEARSTSEKEAALKEQEQRYSNEKLTFSAEAEKKIADQVAMAEKRSAAKLNLAQNQAKLAMFRLDIVKKAAAETPERPVKEVWDAASAAKPTPISNQASTQVAATQALKPPSPATTPVSTGADPALQVKNEQTATVATPQTTNEEATQPTPATTQTEEKPSAPASTKVEQPNTTTLPASGIPSKPPTNHVGTGPGALRQLQGGIPRGSRGCRANLQSSIHARPQSQQGQTSTDNPFGQPSSQTQIPSANRGSGIPRGGARGRGGQARGGSQSVQTSGIPQPAQQASTAGNSPRGGSLNPSAKQFNPQGNKRAREDSDGNSGGDGLAGKRQRGGGAVGSC